MGTVERSYATDYIDYTHTDPVDDEDLAETHGLDVMQVAGYERLSGVLKSAFCQAAHGKGLVRHHEDGVPFDKQGMVRRAKLYPGSAAAQAHKKLEEYKRLDGDAQITELLGAIAYIAGEIIGIEGGQ